MPSYLYGLVPAAASPPSEAGIAGAEVELWPVDESVAVLRSDVQDDAIHPRRAHLTAHDRVLAAAMAESPVLPLRFGIVTELDPEHVREGLDVPAVVQRMQALEGHAEVQVLWTLDQDTALHRVATAVPRVRDTSLPAVDRGRIVAETLTALAIADLEKILDRLHEYVAERASIESRGTGAARVAALVATRDLDAFVAAGDDLADEVATAGVLRTVAGLPPYTFADLGLDLELTGV